MQNTPRDQVFLDHRSFQQKFLWQQWHMHFQAQEKFPTAARMVFMQFKTKGHASASILHKQCFYFATRGSGKCTQQQLVVIVASRPAESGKLAHTVQSGARGSRYVCAVVSRIFEDTAQNLCTRHYYWASPRSNDTQLMQVALPGTHTKERKKNSTFKRLFNRLRLSAQ